jgi:anti-anti-sigma factor
MEIDSTELEGVIAVAVKGRVDSTNADGLRKNLHDIICAGTPRLVIDFKEVSYISSAGFRALLIASRAVEQASGRLALCGIAGEVRRLFDMAAFTELFTILPTRDEAVALLRTGHDAA